MRVCATPKLMTIGAREAPRDPVDVTVVLPAYNEEDTVAGTHEQLTGVMDPTGLSYELLFVDDGSSDGTWCAIVDLAERDDRVRAIRHRFNRGKAAALATGFMFARGNIVALCDADLQYDPIDLVRVIDKVREGYDAVTANKVLRRDPLSKRLPSKFFNLVLRESMGIQLHDMNAGLKAMRADASHELIRYGYGGMHRFFMVILAKKGYTVAEVPVESLPRKTGKSKYGAERYMRGATDFVTVAFLSGYMERPLNLFGTIAVGLGGVGTLLFLAALIFPGRAAGGGVLTNPLLGIGALAIVSSMQLLVIGLVAEMVNNLEHGPVLRGEVSDVIRVNRRTERGPRPIVERRHRKEQPASSH